MMATDVSVADIIKPTNDKRDYRCFFLPNSLNCMVISDPQTTKMAASLSIAIGYFADPDGLHGMADLLNRTLLYGNRHYKDFLHHMNQNDGCIKSQTSAERTSFSFNANSGFLRSALVRFGKFFVEPALVCTDASLEDLQCDSHHEEKNKLNQLQRYLTSKDHPYHKFHPGLLKQEDQAMWKDSVDLMYKIAVNLLAGQRQEAPQQGSLPEAPNDDGDEDSTQE